VPKGTLPKFRLEGLALSAPAIPVPLSRMDSAPLVALELMVRLPETVPGAAGAKLTEKFAVPPAAIVSPALIPLTLKPEPVVLDGLIVMLEFPEFVKVIVCELLLPTATLPKFTLPKLEVRVLPIATALPVSARVCGEFWALSRKTMLPVVEVREVGVN
jgi:hypothetical protein